MKKFNTLVIKFINGEEREYRNGEYKYVGSINGSKIEINGDMYDGTITWPAHDIFANMWIKEMIINGKQSRCQTE